MAQSNVVKTYVKPRATQNALLALAWLTGFAAGCLLFAALAVAWDNAALAFRENLATLASLIGVAVVCAAVALVAGMKTRAAGRLDALRQRAALGDVPRSLLAADQPQPLVDGATTPVTIPMRRRRWVRIGMGLYVAFLAVGGVAMAVFDFSKGRSLEAVYDAGLCALWAWVASSFVGRWHIHASELGLGREVLGLTAVMPWNDARLFAIVRRDRRGRPDTFELATLSSILRWRWVRPDARFWRVNDPELAWPEYEQRMRALHSLIAAKTGLPLYDLSGGGRM
jgi:hypothetical protein